MQSVTTTTPVIQTTTKEIPVEGNCEFSSKPFSILAPINTSIPLIDLSTINSDSEDDLDDLKLMKRKDIDTNALADFFKNTGPEMYSVALPLKDQGPTSPPGGSLKGLLGFFNRKKGSSEDFKSADLSSLPKSPVAVKASTTPNTTQALRLRRKKHIGVEKPAFVDQKNYSASDASLTPSELRFKRFQESYNDVRVDENGVGVYRRKIKVSYDPMDVLVDDNCASIVSKASLEEELEGFVYKNVVVSVKSSTVHKKSSSDEKFGEAISTFSDGTASSEPSSPAVEHAVEYFPVVAKDCDQETPQLCLPSNMPNKENMPLSLEEQVKLLNQELFQERRRRFRAEESNRQTKLKCDHLSAQACKALKLLMNEKYRLEAEVKKLQQSGLVN